jgi:hypothetical protein
VATRTGYRQSGISYREPGLPYNGRRDDGPPPPPETSDTFFLPPIEAAAKVPPWPRVPEIPNRSEAYRHFYANQVGRDVVIAGVTYLGGRWNGPLSAAEITAIRASVYANRLRSIAPGRYEMLPAGLDGPLP